MKVPVNRWVVVIKEPTEGSAVYLWITCDVSKANAMAREYADSFIVGTDGPKVNGRWAVYYPATGDMAGP